MSFAQERLWFLDQLAPESAAYAVPLALQLSGAVDAARVKGAIERLVLRHESLRTRFIEAGGRGIQVVDPVGAVDLEELDLSGLADAAAQEAEAFRLGLEDAAAPFDLARGPLLRARLLRLGAEAHLLLLTFHHIVTDGWSLNVMVRELTALYATPDVELPALPLQYADYALWQRDLADRGAWESSLGIWRQRLSGAPATLDLPTDGLRGGEVSDRGARYDWRLDPELIGDLHRLARGERATLFMTLLAAYAVVLRAWSGQDDVIVGAPVAGRGREEFEAQIGLYVNTVPIRIDMTGDPTLRELLGRVRTRALEAYVHQDVPFERLVAELAPPRAPARQPFFQAMLTLVGAPHQALQLAGLGVVRVPRPLPAAQFDLSLTLEQCGRELNAGLEYAADLFETATIELLARQFEAVLQQMILDPDRALSRIELMSRRKHAEIRSWERRASARVLDGAGRRCAPGVVGRLAPAATGDPVRLARWRADGRLDVLGRESRWPRVAGARVDLDRVEALLREHPDVTDAGAACVGEEASATIVAAVVAPQGVPGDLRVRLRRGLPDHMAPHHIISVPRVERDASGDPIIGLPSAEAASASQAPMTAVEDHLAEIWAQVLGLPRVGAGDNFFDLGGDSIQCIQVAARARAQGLGITVRQMFERQTVRELALIAKPLRLPSKSGAERLPLTVGQRAHIDAFGSDAAHTSLLVEVEAPVSYHRLATALAEVAAHHAVFRTTDWGRMPRWVTDPASVALLDRVGVPADEALRELVERVRPSEGRLLGGAWLGPGEGAGLLLLVASRLAVDPQSWSVVLDDLAATWRSEPLSGRPDCAFADWVARAAEHADPLRSTPTPVFQVTAGLEVSLSAADTSTLLEDGPRANHCSPADLLASAVLLSARAADIHPVVLELHRSVRDDWADELDLRGTVGGLEQPVWIEPASSSLNSPAEALAAVKAELRAATTKAGGRTPPSGPAVVALRFGGPAPGPRGVFRVLDIDLAGADPLPEPRVAAIGAWVVDGRLRLRLTVCPEYARGSPERLARALETELRAVAAYCRTREPALSLADFALLDS
jgi:aryl carrier-like protein